MEYRKFENSYFLRMDRGEEILECLGRLCQAENLTLGTVSGIGAVGEVTLGVFDRQQFAYRSENYTGDLEIASCSGTITTQEGKPYFHLHMVAANPAQGFCQGGHLSRGIISLTGEFVVTALPGRVERRYSPEVGLNLLEFQD